MAMPPDSDAGPIRRLEDMTWPEARQYLAPDSVVLLPVGAIEAHGPHLPLETDVIIAEETAWRAARLLTARGDATVIAPTIAYGVSEVGACFPGTVPVPPGAVTAQVERVLIELARWGPRRLAVVNAHLEPAHIAAVGTGVERAIVASGATIAFPDQREPRWAAGLSEEFRRGARHAGGYETSLLLSQDPNAVRADLLPGLVPVWVDLPAKLRAGARTFAEAGGSDGYFGDPAAATAEEGERLFDALAAMIVAALDELDPTRAIAADPLRS